MCWFVDQNQFLHVEEKLNVDIVATVTEHFGELIINRGNKLTLLGMGIKLTNNGKLKVVMK